MSLLILSFAPVLIILLYVYYRANKRMKTLSDMSVFNPDNQNNVYPS